MDESLNWRRGDQKPVLNMSRDDVKKALDSAAQRKIFLVTTDYKHFIRLP